MLATPILSSQSDAPLVTGTLTVSGIFYNAPVSFDPAEHEEIVKFTAEFEKLEKEERDRKLMAFYERKRREARDYYATEEANAKRRKAAEEIRKIEAEKARLEEARRLEKRIIDFIDEEESEDFQVNIREDDPHVTKYMIDMDLLGDRSCCWSESGYLLVFVFNDDPDSESGEEGEWESTLLRRHMTITADLHN